MYKLYLGIPNQCIRECYQHFVRVIWGTPNGIQCNLTSSPGLIITCIYPVINLHVINIIRRAAWSLVIHFKHWLHTLRNNPECCLLVIVFNNVNDTLVCIHKLTNNSNITFFYTEARKYHEHDRSLHRLSNDVLLDLTVTNSKLLFTANI